MSAKADFACIACDELMELPLKAAACPVCGGLLERRFTPPMVTTQAARETVKLAEATAAQQAPASRIAPEQRSRGMHAAAALGAVAPGGRAASMPVIGALQGKGPRPIWHRG